jgi:hypothetical protein
LPTEPNVVNRLRKLGFVPQGQRGIATKYRSSDGLIQVDLDGKSQHFALVAEHLTRLPDSGDRGSVYVHRAKETEPPELRREAVLVANGPYQRFFHGVVPPSGRGTNGDASAWRDVALEALLAELEKKWLTPPAP